MVGILPYPDSRATSLGVFRSAPGLPLTGIVPVRSGHDSACWRAHDSEHWPKALAEAAAGEAPA